MINIPKGTKDVLPSEAYKWHFVENTARRIAALYECAAELSPLLSVPALQREFGLLEPPPQDSCSAEHMRTAAMQ